MLIALLLVEFVADPLPTMVRSAPPARSSVPGDDELSTTTASPLPDRAIPATDRTETAVRAPKEDGAHQLSDRDLNRSGIPRRDAGCWGRRRCDRRDRIGRVAIARRVEDGRRPRRGRAAAAEEDARAGPSRGVRRRLHRAT